MGEPVPLTKDIIDMVVVRGLSVNRAENKNSDRYHRYIDIENMGLVIYTPLEITNPDNYIDPKLNKIIYNEYKKALMRILLCFKSSIRLRVIRPDGSKVKIDEKLHSWKHLGVFETQLKPP